MEPTTGPTKKIRVIISREELIDRIERATTRMQNNGARTAAHKLSSLVILESATALVEMDAVNLDNLTLECEVPA